MKVYAVGGAGGGSGTRSGGNAANQQTTRTRRGGLRQTLGRVGTGLGAVGRRLFGRNR